MLAGPSQAVPPVEDGPPAGQIPEPARPSRERERPRHRDRVGSRGDRGVDENGVSPDLHRLRRVAGHPQARVDDDRNAGLLHDHLDRIARAQAPVGTDPGAEGHDGGAARLLETVAQHRVRAAVRQHDEAFRDQALRGEQSFDRVGRQGARVGRDLQLDEVAARARPPQPGEPHRLVRVAGPAGVRQQCAARGNEVEDVAFPDPVQIHPAEGDRDDLGAAGDDSLPHQQVRGELPRADEQP